MPRTYSHEFDETILSEIQIPTIKNHPRRHTRKNTKRLPRRGISRLCTKMQQPESLANHSPFGQSLFPNVTDSASWNKRQVLLRFLTFVLSIVGFATAIALVFAPVVLTLQSLDLGFVSIAFESLIRRDAYTFCRRQRAYSGIRLSFMSYM